MVSLARALRAPRIGRWLALLLLAGCAAAPGDSSALAPSASPIPPTSTVAPSASPIPPTITVAPPSPSPAPPTSTVAPPSPTPAGVIAAATLTPAPAEPTAAPAAPAAAPGEQRYVFPVQGARVEYGAYHHDYPATDIFCPEGSLFVAPTDGVIDFVSYADAWSPANDDPALRGGIAVAMIGDDGVRYYGSHLSAVAEGIAVGARVTAGQTLGLTGKSGNARSTPPHVHFGISRPTTPDDWQVRRGEVSPYPYLQAWAAGESVTPALP